VIFHPGPRGVVEKGTLSFDLIMLSACAGGSAATKSMRSGIEATVCMVLVAVRAETTKGEEEANKTKRERKQAVTPQMVMHVWFGASASVSA
jgi:hypothetical protein